MKQNFVLQLGSFISFPFLPFGISTAHYNTYLKFCVYHSFNNISHICSSKDVLFNLILQEMIQSQLQFSLTLPSVMLFITHHMYLSSLIFMVPNIPLSEILLMCIFVITRFLLLLLMRWCCELSLTDSDISDSLEYILRNKILGSEFSTVQIYNMY